MLVVPERKRRFKPVEAKQKDMSLYYGIAPKAEKQTLLRRKRKINLHKLYDFIKSFMSVLVKRPVQEAKQPIGSPAPKPTVHPVADPLQDAKILTDISLDEIMIDPVTKLKITRRQWEAMGTGHKSAEVTKPLEANYEYKAGKKPNANESTASVAFPPLPRDEKTREFNPVKNPIKSIPKL